jgi:hypothetical protein
MGHHNPYLSLRITAGGTGYNTNRAHAARPQVKQYIKLAASRPEMVTREDVHRVQGLAGARAKKPRRLFIYRVLSEPLIKAVYM